MFPGLRRLPATRPTGSGRRAYKMSIGGSGVSTEQLLTQGDFISAVRALKDILSGDLIVQLDDRLSLLRDRLAAATEGAALAAIRKRNEARGLELDAAIKKARDENLAEKDSIVRLRKDAVRDIDALKRLNTEEQTKRLQEIAAEEDRVNAAREEVADRLAKVATREEELEAAGADLKAREKAMDDKAKRIAA